MSQNRTRLNQVANLAALSRHPAWHSSNVGVSHAASIALVPPEHEEQDDDKYHKADAHENQTNDKALQHIKEAIAN